jgi:hypothetical protein
MSIEIERLLIAPQGAGGPSPDSARNHGYGKRATPYEVLSEFSGRMAHAFATEDLLPRMARWPKAPGRQRPEGDERAAAAIDQAAEQLALALQELRELARGIRPAILTERGLGPALQSLAERSTVPASVESTLDGRMPPEVEATAYFVVSEALANVGKYSKATAVTIRVGTSDGELWFEVSDDGVGGADASRGSGLRGLADRVAAVDGRLEVESPLGQGTRLTCWIRPDRGAPTARPRSRRSQFWQKRRNDDLNHQPKLRQGSGDAGVSGITRSTAHCRCPLAVSGFTA